MAAPEEATEMPFIFTDSRGKLEPANRKLVRKFVMLGKNRGRSRHAKPASITTPCNPDGPDEGQEGTLGLSISMRYSAIPRKVGSEFSFTQFAADVEPALLHDVLKFSFIAERVLYPLERYIIFPRKTKVDTSWFDLLSTDAAYVHAAVFASQAYASHTSARKGLLTTTKILLHHSAALHLLRERLLAPSREGQVSDATVVVVLHLARHAHLTNDYGTAKHHMEGMRSIVSSRGGLNAFDYNTKLITEILKCDLAIALNNGTATMFFSDPYLKPLMRYNLESLLKKRPQSSERCTYWMPAELGIHHELCEAWEFLRRFSSKINSIAKHKRQLHRETLLGAMVSIMYRLLRMNIFEPASVDEAIRLGLLIFSSHIFLNWQGVKLPHTHLPDTYRRCLLDLKLPHSLPSQLILWLIMIGSVSVFPPADDAWLIPWVRVNIDLCGERNWTGLRRQLKEFLWIDILHDKPGLKRFEAALLPSTASGTVSCDGQGNWYSQYLESTIDPASTFPFNSSDEPHHR